MIRKFWFPTSIILLYLITIPLQQYAIFNWDVAYAIQVANKMLAGGHYYTDFFNSNPPLAFYIYIPVVALEKIVNPIAALQFYILLIASCSLGISYNFIKKLFSKKDLLLAQLFILALAVGFLILPTSTFGQRAHIGVMFLTPYFLLAAMRVQNSPSLWLRFFVMLFAAIGFLLCPTFAIIFIAVEIYIATKQQRFYPFLNIEIFIMALLTVIYLLSIVVFYSDYIHQILPIVLSFYHQGYFFSFASLSTQEILSFSLLTLLMLFFLYRELSHHTIYDILVISMIGFIISYYFYHRVYYYHLLPLFIQSLLLITLIAGETWIKIKNTPSSPQKKYDKLMLVTLLLMIFLFAVVYTACIYFANHQFKEKEIIPQLNFLKSQKNPPPTVFFFTAVVSSTYPLLTYANISSASRLDCLWPLPGIVKEKNKTKASEGKKLLTQLVVDDLTRNKPKFIFIDASETKRYIGQPFNYIQYFSENSQFKNLISKYHYINTISDYAIYEVR